jgi:hypothetical protein
LPPTLESEPACGAAFEDVISVTPVAIVDQDPVGKHLESSNLVGKINSLATTDMANIRDARDFMSILVYIPLNIFLATSFLYAILGWRYVSHPLPLSLPISS